MMQITITQVDIEQAIREYIGAQITVKEGMDISMKLSATRGAEGFTALITIAPKGDPAHEEQASSTPAPTGNKPGPKPKVAPAVEVVETVVDKAPVEEAAAAVDESSVETTVIEEPAETEVLTAEVVETAQPRSSLFGGLKKPVNG